MSYFGTRRISREELRHQAHGELIKVCAQYIATLEGDTQEIACEALKMYMSIKVGDTKRETILEGYDAILAEAGVQL